MNTQKTKPSSSLIVVKYIIYLLLRICRGHLTNSAGIRTRFNRPLWHSLGSITMQLVQVLITPSFAKPTPFVLLFLYHYHSHNNYNQYPFKYISINDIDKYSQPSNIQTCTLLSILYISAGNTSTKCVQERI